MQTCSKCGEANEASATFCRNRACGAVLEWHGQPVEPDDRTGAVHPDQPSRDRPRTRRVAVGVSLEAATLEVEPGDDVTCRVRLRNRGSIVDQYRVVVVGPLAEWATCDPGIVNLLPDQEGEVTVRFAPPRASEPNAGAAPFEVHVTSTHDPSVAAVEHGVVDVAAFQHLAGELSPATIEARREGTARLSIGNRGNAPVRLALAGREPDERLDLDLVPSTLVCEPGTTATATLHARARSQPLIGSPSRHTLVVTATHEGDPLETPALQKHGAFEHRPLIPRVPGAIAIVLASVLVLALVAVSLVSRPTDGDDVEVLSLVGLGVEEAEARLADGGLTLGAVSERESADTEAGRIIDQDPASGQRVPEGSAIDVTVAVAQPDDGPTVPAVVGLDQDDACELIEAADLVCRAALLRDHREGAVIPPAGEVVRQSPAAGERAEPGSTVTISVSAGP